MKGADGDNAGDVSGACIAARDPKPMLGKLLLSPGAVSDAILQRQRNRRCAVSSTGRRADLVGIPCVLGVVGTPLGSTFQPWTAEETLTSSN